MESTCASLPPAHAFVEQLLATGGTLVHLVENLVAALEEHGSSRDEATVDILEMVMGTVAVRFASIPEPQVVRATELMDLAIEGVLADLEQAAELARRRERGHRRAQRSPCR
jgi:hypothetical protein